MTCQTIEQKRQLYARELADYTLRQWNAVRSSQPQNIQGKATDERKEQEKAVTPSHRNEKKGIQVIDYARMSPKGGVGREPSPF